MNFKPIVLALIAIVSWAADGTVHKTSYESFDCSMEFSTRAPDAITIDSVTASNSKTKADVSAAIISASPAPTVVSNTKVVLRVQGGNVGEEYLISIKVIRPSTGEKYEGTILLHISTGF